MIALAFTVDYEIYGTGRGSLRELVLEPAERLRSIFGRHGARFVTFVEAAELEAIEERGADRTIRPIKQQLRDIYGEGFEIGLHLHPQWYNAQYRDGTWLLDDSEYSLRDLSRERIGQIVDRSIAYLRGAVGEEEFIPFSFRAGNWLYQPSPGLSEALAERGIKVDSSVYKGGLQHRHKLDYRPALKNGYFWTFGDDVNIPDPHGVLMEFPIYTTMEPIWKLLTAKRLDLQKKGSSGLPPSGGRLFRLMDRLRYKYPMKFDFCRMSIHEMTQVLDKEMRKDRENPGVFRPIIAIGHTKDLDDLETVDGLLSILGERHIKITGFHELYHQAKS
jgi:peptidoglycan/xylan/chitin deacetylase (PgdA/CDA1 family)